MARPYNKKTIADAALICETVASNPHSTNDLEWHAIFLGIRLTSTALDLAGAAVDAVIDVMPKPTNPDDEAGMWAEAAALILDGWQIGEPVSLLENDLPFVERTLRLVGDEPVVTHQSTTETVEHGTVTVTETETPLDVPDRIDVPEAIQELIDAGIVESVTTETVYGPQYSEDDEDGDE